MTKITAASGSARCHRVLVHVAEPDAIEEGRDPAREPRADAEIGIGRKRRHDLLGVAARARVRELRAAPLRLGVVLDRAQHSGSKISWSISAWRLASLNGWMRSFSRVLSSSIARLNRRRIDQRTPGISSRSITDQSASAPTISISQSGSEPATSRRSPRHEPSKGECRCRVQWTLMLRSIAPAMRLKAWPGAQSVRPSFDTRSPVGCAAQERLAPSPPRSACARSCRRGRH